MTLEQIVNQNYNLTQKINKLQAEITAIEYKLEAYGAGAKQWATMEAKIKLNKSKIAQLKADLEQNKTF